MSHLLVNRKILENNKGMSSSSSVTVLSKQQRFWFQCNRNQNWQLYSLYLLSLPIITSVIKLNLASYLICTDFHFTFAETLKTLREIPFQIWPLPHGYTWTEKCLPVFCLFTLHTWEATVVYILHHFFPTFVFSTD